MLKKLLPEVPAVLVVVLVAAVAIPVFLSQRNKGFDAAARSDVRQIATLQETALAAGNGYHGGLQFSG